MIRRIVFTSLLALGAANVQANPAEIYNDNCASCHGAARLGGTGPALIPETLGRMRGPNLEKVIANGRAATQMPGNTARRRAGLGPGPDCRNLVAGS